MCMRCGPLCCTQYRMLRLILSYCTINSTDWVLRHINVKHTMSEAYQCEAHHVRGISMWSTPCQDTSLKILCDTTRFRETGALPAWIWYNLIEHYSVQRHHGTVSTHPWLSWLKASQLLLMVLKWHWILTCMNSRWSWSWQNNFSTEGGFQTMQQLITIGPSFPTLIQ